MTSRPVAPPNKGFLAIWCEIGEGDLADYRAWITKEHIADRSFLPGWLMARFCCDVNNERAHFFLYATESKDVFAAAPYRQVLDNPSPWTRRLMPKFGPFDRALGEQVFKLGNGFGGHLVVARITHDAPADLAMAQQHLAALLDVADVASVRLMKLDRATSGAGSAEKAMRQGPEGDFNFLLVAEALSEAGARAAQSRLDQLLRHAFPKAAAHDSSVRRVLYGETAFEGQTA